MFLPICDLQSPPTPQPLLPLVNSYVNAYAFILCSLQISLLQDFAHLLIFLSSPQNPWTLIIHSELTETLSKWPHMPLSLSLMVICISPTRCQGQGSNHSQPPLHRRHSSVSEVMDALVLARSPEVLAGLWPGHSVF
jgi:hypothetical protein